MKTKAIIMDYRVDDNNNDDNVTTTNKTMVNMIEEAS